MVEYHTVSQHLFVYKISYPCCLVVEFIDVQVSLELAPARVASEYYTAEEMVQFKRPKKRRKIRKKEKVKADDLLSLESQAHSSGGASKDHGSRRSAI
jgi:hypothetical protein